MPRPTAHAAPLASSPCRALNAPHAPPATHLFHPTGHARASPQLTAAPAQLPLQPQFRTLTWNPKPQAGSERIAKSEVAGAQLKEAQAINKSLSALGDVIAALQCKTAHIPYRNSRLTQVPLAPQGGHRRRCQPLFASVLPLPGVIPPPPPRPLPSPPLRRCSRTRCAVAARFCSCAAWRPRLPPHRRRSAPSTLRPGRRRSSWGQ